MRKTLTALMFAAALPTLAMAAPPMDGPGHGDGPGRGFGPEHRGPAPFEQLDVTREQRQDIDRLMREERRNEREITREFLTKLPAAEQKAMKDRIDASHDKAHADIRGLLKPEQQKRFDEMKKEQDQRRAEWDEFQAWKASKKTQ